MARGSAILNGTTAHIVSESPNVPSGATFTVGAWFYIANRVADTDQAFFYANSVTDIGVRLGTANQLRMSGYPDNLASVPPGGEWFYLALVVEAGVGGTVYHYNAAGVQQESTFDADWLAGAVDEIIIGNNASGGLGTQGWTSSGLRVAHARIWEAALTEAQIEAELASISPVITGSLVEAFENDPATDGWTVSGVTVSTAYWPPNYPVTTVTRYVNPDSAGGDGTTPALSGANAAYASLAAWNTARARDLMAAHEVEEVICATNGTADGPVEILSTDGWVTDATRYIHVKVDAASRHAGKWDDTKYRIVGFADVGGVVECTVPYTRFSGLQVYANVDDNSQRPFAAYAPGITIEGCIGRLLGTAYTYGNGCSYVTGPVDEDGGGTQPLRVYNSLFYGAPTNREFVGIRADNSWLEVFNCTIVGGGVGVANCIGIRDSYGHVTAKNNIVIGFEAPFYGGFASTDYNSTDTTSSYAGTNGRTSQTFSFRNAAAKDYGLLASDTGAKDFGLADPGSGLFSTDITRYARSGSWDIGAYEYRVLTEPTHLSTAQYGASYTQPGGGVTTCVNSVDVGSGANRCILVKHYRRIDRAIAIQSVTLGGESMAVLGSDVQLVGNYYIRTFALVNPTVEGTQDLVITCTTNASNSVGQTVVSVYDGVDPNANEADLLVLVETDTVTTPWTSPYTAVVPSAAGELAVAMDFSYSDDVSCFLTASGFNERINAVVGGVGYAAGDKAGEASATFTWTPSFLSQDLTVVHHGFSLPPAPADDGFVARLPIRSYIPLLVR